ncbi:pectinesterase inhibitor 6-like [Carex rostrata]
MATIIIPLLISLLLLVSFPSFHSKNTSNNYHTYLKRVCDDTPYRKLCTHSLASFAPSVPKDSIKGWARVAVLVAMSESRRISTYLVKNHQGSPTFTDCTECMRDATVQLQSSKAELKHLDKSKFELQMNDIVTWVSAALTDANTCTDGLMYYKGEQFGGVKHKVLKAAHLCSNALAFVNKLASSRNIN